MVAQRCATFAGPVAGSSFKGRTSTAAALELVYYASPALGGFCFGSTKACPLLTPVILPSRRALRYTQSWPISLVSNKLCGIMAGITPYARGG